MSIYFTAINTLKVNMVKKTKQNTKHPLSFKLFKEHSFHTLNQNKSKNALFGVSSCSLRTKDKNLAQIVTIWPVPKDPAQIWLVVPTMSFTAKRI